MPASLGRERRMGVGAIGLAAMIWATPFVAMPASVAGAASEAETAPPSDWLTVVANLQAPVSTDALMPVALDPLPTSGPFSMNLYRKGDFVHQATTYWCVAASVQTMMNIIDEGRPKRSAAYQKRLHFEGRQLEPDEDGYWRKLAGPSRWRRGLHGLGLTEWTGMLNTNGWNLRAGPGEDPEGRHPACCEGDPHDRHARRLGRMAWCSCLGHVGLHRHRRPCLHGRFRGHKRVHPGPLVSVHQLDLGRSRPPDSRYRMSGLARDFLPYKRPGRRQPMRDGKFMLVLPTPPSEPVQGYE